MNAEIDLSGKTVVVTGGSMGLGLASAAACLKYGANVLLAARGERALADAAATLAGGDRVSAVAADVGSEAGVERIFVEAIARFGRCDGVVHAAAILGPIGPLVEVDPAQWWETLRIDLFGAFLVTRTAARHMKAHGGGRIVLYSGGGAAAPFPNYTAYACSKAAVVRFTETAALELRPDVEVNCVAPGLVATRMLEATLAAGKRAGGEGEKQQKALASGSTASPEIAAEACAFLVSDAARGISGRMVAAVHDDYRTWKSRGAPLDAGDLFTLRRIVPRDRGLDWQ